MITKPVAAIERMREWIDKYPASDMKNEREVLAYLASIPDDAVPVVWPKELTRERLERLADSVDARVIDTAKLNDALRALAAIAPERKKRVVNLWRDLNGHLHEREVNREPERSWRPAARNVELED